MDTNYKNFTFHYIERVSWITWCTMGAHVNIEASVRFRQETRKHLSYFF
nr:MAG TPA: hypothetical protein [Caudoviricetes sp.]